MKILIDMDDVMENLLVSWVKYLNDKYNLSVDVNSIDNWDFQGQFLSLTREQIKEALSDEELWKSVEPIDGAVETINKIISDGDEVYVVTATDYRSLKLKMENVLLKYFPCIDKHNVIIAYNKQMIKGDVLIDDGVHNLINGDYEKILFDAPHNRDFSAESFGMYRAKNWDDVYDIIQVLKRPKTCVGVRRSSGNARNDLFEGGAGSKI